MPKASNNPRAMRQGSPDASIQIAEAQARQILEQANMQARMIIERANEQARNMEVVSAHGVLRMPDMPDIPRHLPAMRESEPFFAMGPEGQQAHFFSSDGCELSIGETDVVLVPVDVPVQGDSGASAESAQASDGASSGFSLGLEPIVSVELIDEAEGETGRLPSVEADILPVHSSPIEIDAASGPCIPFPEYEPQEAVQVPETDPSPQAGQFADIGPLFTQESYPIEGNAFDPVMLQGFIDGASEQDDGGEDFLQELLRLV